MKPLSTLIGAQRGLSPVDAAGWCIRLCRHVESLHEFGVAHGSLSADCIQAESTSCSGAGSIDDVRRSKGVPNYYSPERHAHDSISVADDAWAIAVILYFSLTAKLPFEGDTPAAIAKQAISSPLVPLSEFGIAEPDLQAVLDQFLVRNIAKRVVRVAMMRTALEAWFPEDKLGQLGPLGDEGVEDENSLFDDDDEVLTVMRSGDELRQQLSHVGPLPTAPAGNSGEDLGGATVMMTSPVEDAVTTVEVAPESDDEGASTVMMMSPLAGVDLTSNPASRSAEPDGDWDGGAATMMMSGISDMESEDEEDVATMMIDGVESEALAALEEELARRARAAAPAPAAGNRAPASQRGAAGAGAGGLPGWSTGRASSAPKAAPRSSVEVAPGVQKPRQAATVSMQRGPAAAHLGVEIPTAREVFLRRALYVAVFVFIVLVAFIVWLLLKRNGVV